MNFWAIIFFTNLLSNFLALLLCKMKVLGIFNKVDFFQIFFILPSTEILIESNFWLGMYAPYILKCLRVSRKGDQLTTVM